MSVRRILPKIALGLLLVLALILWINQRQVNKEAKEALTLEEQLRPLNIKRQKLKKQLEELSDGYEADRRPKATTQILFTEPDARVYELCYPIMKEYGFVGVIALSAEQLPGTENCMTEEQLTELIQDGWSVCARFDNSTRLNAQWTSLQKQFKKYNLDDPTTAYFASGVYGKGLDAVVAQCGFTIAIHHGEEGLPLVQPNDEEGIWHLGSVGLKGHEPRLRFTEAIEAKANIITLVGFSVAEETYVEKSFRSMLDSCKQYVAKEELMVSGCEDARLHFKNRTQEAAEADKQAYLQQKQVLEAELAELEKQIEKLQ